MSVVIWDGKSLAADKLATDCDMGTLTTKIKALADGRIVAWVGGYFTGKYLADWYEKGADPIKWPSFQSGGDEGARLIIMHPDGKCEEYANSPAPVCAEVIGPFRAWGSGRDFAMGALAMGATAAEAVQIVSQFCITCGGGIDVYHVQLKKSHRGSQDLPHV